VRQSLNISRDTCSLSFFNLRSACLQRCLIGFKKTYDRIDSRFYWPGLYTAVQSYCQSCSVCQLSGSKNVPKFPLQPLPIIDFPFSRIVMEIVGPLERVCVTTVLAILKLFLCETAKQISHGLLQLFSRVEIASEILTDQRTNLLSNTLKQVYKLLGSIRTTPYHPHTDGLVERYKRTLKSMLKKVVAINRKEWDRWLPYLLFAYWEVLQASTGLSSIELLYGRQARGPLDALQESWTGNGVGTATNVLTYVLKMSGRMEKATKLMRNQMEKVQRDKQTWYDKGARQRSFETGQLVLLLLLTTENKLLARWQGPYSIVRKLGPATHVIEMPERWSQRQIFTSIY